MTQPASEPLPETNEETRRLREGELDDVFARQQGSGWAEAHEDDYAGFGGAADGDGE